MTNPTDSDRERFRRLYADTADRVLAYALRHVGPADAEDIVAETFGSAWSHRADVPTEPLPWLLVVARHKIADLRRRRGRRPETLDAEPRLLRLASRHDSPEATVVDRETLLAAVAALTPIEREALLLTAWDGLTAAQAAQVLGCSRIAFSTRLHRARARLAASLDVDEQPAPASRLTTLLGGHTS